MNAFEQGLAVEAQGMAILEPFLRVRAFDGRYVLINKGPLKTLLQKSVGDVLMNTSSSTMTSVEVKCERNSRYGNFFLETWSNRNLKDRYDHAERGSSMGWMYTLRADWLMYYFVETDDLYIMDFFFLKQWAFTKVDGCANLYRYPERPQSKYAQKNDTWGCCVPIVDIAAAMGSSIKLTHPRKILAECREAA